MIKRLSSRLWLNTFDLTNLHASSFFPSVCRIHWRAALLWTVRPRDGAAPDSIPPMTNATSSRPSAVRMWLRCTTFWRNTIRWVSGDNRSIVGWSRLSGELHTCCNIRLFVFSLSAASLLWSAMATHCCLSSWGCIGSPWMETRHTWLLHAMCSLTACLSSKNTISR